MVLPDRQGRENPRLAEEFRRQGYIIFNCDAIAREVIDGSPSCLKELKEGFGADIFFADGSLNRKRLAAKAFSSQEQTQKLNRITHPWIRREILERIEKIRRAGRRPDCTGCPVAV